MTKVDAEPIDERAPVMWKAATNTAVETAMPNTTHHGRLAAFPQPVSNSFNS
jgi:hypothetical protein